MGVVGPPRLVLTADMHLRSWTLVGKKCLNCKIAITGPISLVIHSVAWRIEETEELCGQSPPGTVGQSGKLQKTVFLSPPRSL